MTMAETGLVIHGFIALDAEKLVQLEADMRAIGDAYMMAAAASREDITRDALDSVLPLLRAMVCRAELEADTAVASGAADAATVAALKKAAGSKVQELAGATGAAGQARSVALQLVVDAVNAVVALLNTRSAQLLQELMRLTTEAKMAATEVASLTSPPASPDALRRPATVFAQRVVDVCRMLQEHGPRFPDDIDRRVLARAAERVAALAPKLIAVARQQLVLPDCLALIVKELAEVARVARAAALSAAKVVVCNSPGEHEVQLRQLVDAATCHDQGTVTKVANYAVAELRRILDTAAVPEETAVRLRARLSDVLVAARAQLFAPSDFGSSERSMQLKAAIDAYNKLLESVVPFPDSVATVAQSAETPSPPQAALLVPDEESDVFTAAASFVASKGLAMLLADLIKP
jgi:hypothetical protein